MRKDYVRKISSSKKVRRKKTTANSLSRIILCGLIGCGLALFAWGFYALQHAKPFGVNRLPAWLQHHPSTSAVVPHANQSALTQKNTAPVDGVQFDFYDTLPNGQSTLPVAPPAAVPVASVLSATPPPAAAAHTPQWGYFLTFGEFAVRSEAAKARLSLLLAGVDSKIIKLNKQGHFIWQIQKGPFSSQKAAHNEMAHLKRKGIESHVDKNEIDPT